MEKSRLISLITVCFSNKKEVVSSVKKQLMIMITIAINITKTTVNYLTNTWNATSLTYAYNSNQGYFIEHN